MKVDPADECEPSATGVQVAVATGEVAETGEAAPMDAPTAGEKVAAASYKAMDTTARETYTCTAPQIPKVDCQYQETGWRTMQPGDSPQRGRESVRATNMVEINDNRQEVVDKELRNRATTDHRPAHRIRNIAVKKYLVGRNDKLNLSHHRAMEEGE
jgi:hypothetical protein